MKLNGEKDGRLFKLINVNVCFDMGKNTMRAPAMPGVASSVGGVVDESCGECV